MSSPIAKPSDENSGVLALTASWGWQEPPDEVTHLAEWSIRAREDSVMDMLVDLELLSHDELAEKLESCPADAVPVDWLAQTYPDLAPAIEQVLTLRSGYPFYSNTSLLRIHPRMNEDAIIARADQVEAVLMLIESEAPVILFSSYEGLLKFRSMGRAERSKDPLLAVAGGGADAKYAVSSREKVLSLLKNARGLEPDSAATSASTVWDSVEDIKSPEAREIGRLIEHALAQFATDISLMPLPNRGLRVLMRRHGSLVRPTVADFYRADVAARIVNLLMARSGANPSNTRVREPRDGQMSYISKFRRAFLRLSFIPLNHLGETEDVISVSIRILPTSDRVISLDMLQVSAPNAQQMRFALQYSQGLVLLSGPTNSGKSTTIAACLAEHVKMFGESQKRISVEDPVERQVEGVIQINVPSHITDETKRFKSILPSIKRHDPDVIWVGEIRDPETANLCVQAASSGHLVFSTIHANDALLAYDVLSKMVSSDMRFQLIEAMLLSVSQRIVRRLCPACRVVHSPSVQDRELFERHLLMSGESATLPDEVARANPQGCPACRSGFIGMVPINEALPFSRQVKAACNLSLDGRSNPRDFLAESRVTTLLGGMLERVASLDVEFAAIFT